MLGINTQSFALSVLVCRAGLVRQRLMAASIPPEVDPQRVCQVLVSHWGATLHMTATATKIAIRPMRLVISVSSR